MQPNNRSHRASRLASVPLSVWAVLISAGLVLGATLMSQTLTPPAGTANPLTANCAAPAGSTQVTASSGPQSFACASTAAFTVNVAGTHTPAFALSAPYSGLFVVPSSSAVAASCGVTTGAQALTSGASVSLALGSYDYCADFTNYPSTAPTAFVVSWS